MSFVSLIFSCISSCIFQTAICNAQFSKSFPYLAWLVFTRLTISFAMEVFNFMISHLWNVSLMSCSMEILLRKFLPVLIIIPNYSSRSFRLSDFMLRSLDFMMRSLVHLDLCFIQSEKKYIYIYKIQLNYKKKRSIQK